MLCGGIVYNKEVLLHLSSSKYIRKIDKVRCLDQRANKTTKEGK